ncbi:glycosyltransferase [Prevotella copri]|jgi:glycosyltransferase involved in cell wall biosynthesis|uniref:Glycosyltransferase n=1 Tax=Segatella copri TaxID=165179 RepID=A0AAP2TU90_9BACT|nr:glycosyltransferase [Segatella copri]MCE4121583.1 glycosyltransferase [Segatella copri]MCP9497950.1 glycosyltransferase [Segatella copri]MCP9512889.1 glycosyltransferase [Segatella copri]MCP9521872.1 glycosyltransferase [Segatella copri]MCP9547671.1 glycosyltransferase [Segatella copri]
MKILHIGNLKSGIDTYVRNTVALASDKFEFVIVNGADDNSKPYMRHGKQVKTYSIDMYRALNPVKDIKAVMQAIKIIKKEKADLVHCHSAKGGVIGRFAAFLTGTKVVYTAHAFSFLSAESAKKKQIFLLLEKIAKLNSYLLACSDSERELGIKVVGFNEEKAFAWNNAVPDADKGLTRISQISRISSQKNEASDLPVPKEGERYITSIGRPSYQKNPLFMVEVAHGIHLKHPDIKFYLLGVGFYSPMLEDMKRLIHQYDMDDTFYLLPWLSHEETLKYVKGSLLYFMTSLYEGLPISVIEAMSLGKAIVASDVLGNKDCVKDGYNGYLLPLKEEVFVEKMNDLIENDEKRKEMEKNSRSYFESDFFIDNRIKALEEIYTEVYNR